MAPRREGRGPAVRAIAERAVMRIDPGNQRPDDEAFLRMRAVDPVAAGGEMAAVGHHRDDLLVRVELRGERHQIGLGGERVFVAEGAVKQVEHRIAPLSASIAGREQHVDVHAVDDQVIEARIDDRRVARIHDEGARRSHVLRAQRRRENERERKTPSSDSGSRHVVPLPSFSPSLPRTTITHMGHEHAFRPLSGAGVFERLARDAQGSSSLGEFRVEMLKVLLRDLGGDSAAVLEPPGKNATRAEIQSRTAALGSSADYEDRYLRDKDRYDRSIPDLMRAIRTSGAVIDNEVYGTRPRARLARYAHVLLPQGTSSILAAAASWRGRPTAL